MKPKKKNDYIKMLNKRLFWEYNIDQLDYRKSKQKIIERIAVYGNENDEKIMNILYPIRTIKKCLMQSFCLTEPALRYYAAILSEKEEDFKCYTRLSAPRYL